MHSINSMETIDTFIESESEGSGSSNESSASSGAEIGVSSSPSDFETTVVSENFHLNLATNAKTYKKRLEHFRRLLWSKTNLSEEAQRYRYANGNFDPQELVDNYALSMPPPFQMSELGPDLPNYIHPLFAFGKWCNVSAEIYDVLKPGLRLASWFLTHWSCARFWHTLLLGHRELEPGFPDDARRWRIRSPLEWSIRGEVAWSQALDEIAESTTFQFATEPFGMKYAEAVWTPRFDHETRRIRFKIAVNADYHTVAKKLSIMRPKDPLMGLRFNLLFAVTLCHEMAHATDYKAREHLRGTDIFHETYLYNDETAESGESWESAMFNGQVCAISNRTDTLHGLCLTYGGPYPETTSCMIPMHYVWALQRWETYPFYLHEYKGHGHFHLPRVGVVAYGPADARVYG